MYFYSDLKCVEVTRAGKVNGFRFAFVWRKCNSESKSAVMKNVIPLQTYFKREESLRAKSSETRFWITSPFLTGSGKSGCFNEGFHSIQRKKESLYINWEKNQLICNGMNSEALQQGTGNQNNQLTFSIHRYLHRPPDQIKEHNAEVESTVYGFSILYLVRVN